MDQMEKAEKAIEKTRESISVVFPLFIRLLFDTETEPNAEIDTLQTDGESIEYNPKFINVHHRRDHPFFILHEFCHIFLGHNVRFNPDVHDMDDWQISADYAANALLMEAGVRLWKNAYYERKYRAMSVEDIYDLVHADKSSPQFDKSQHGQVLPPPPDSEEGEGEGEGDGDKEDKCAGSPQQSKNRQQAIEESENKMRQAMQTAAMAGNIPASLERYITDIHKPLNNWQDILAQVLVAAKGMDAYTFSKINRRRTESEFIFPGMESEECGVIAVVADTSGSADAPDLDMCSCEIRALVEELNPEELVFMSCDMRVRTYQRFDCGEEPKLEITGGGGTCFKAPFERLEEEDIEPEVLVYLTDGYCSSFPPEPDYPVIWVCWQDRLRFEPPFGEVVVMEGR